VVASVGHHTDRTLLDDVAAVSCSTPTHAAEAAVPLHVGEARESLARGAARLAHHGRRAVLDRARVLARLSRAPGEHLARQRRTLHQSLRELRASATRRLGEARAITGTRAEVLRRKAAAAAGPDAAARRAALDGLALALGAHDPQRVLERGYAVVEERDGSGVITSAAAARAAREVRVKFSDAAVDATINDDEWATRPR
jgi:exodeoxyribonuclease VII large subunit